jgi:hypothetical protein
LEYTSEIWDNCGQANCNRLEKIQSLFFISSGISFIASLISLILSSLNSLCSASGGCSGFSYGFTFDDKQKEGDSGVAKNGVQLVVDPKK